MATGALALGKTINVVPIFAPADAVAGAITGNRVHMRGAEICTFVLTASAGSTDITDIDLNEHTAAVNGTSRDLDIITKFYYQSEATLDGDEVWVEGVQAAASEITDVGAASEQLLLVVEVKADQLSDDAEWLSINVPDLGSNGTRWVSCVAILSSLKVQRKPTLLVQQNA